MEYLILLINVCLYVCLSNGQPSELGANCVGIMCSPPNCLDTFIPLGGCCPTCAGPGRPCSYRGKNYKDSQSFKDNCNTCTCTDGAVGCTQMLCPDDKRGSCPSPSIVGSCVENCVTDADCPRRQKCCSNGCGHTCMKPEKGKPCTHKGVQYRNGASFPDDCNTCTCTDGLTSCTEMACPGKPGSCPAPVGGGLCLETCNDDYGCPGEEKCCNNGCGRTCLIPISGGKSCLYNGITYNDGENFMDDCNTCRCVNGNAGCTRMACPKRNCFHHGINYTDGETFYDDCNACVCSDGIAQCTKMACPDVKPGLCPIATSAGICIERCTTDVSCPGREKCCRNGCSTQCLLPSFGGRPCLHKGETYNDGGRFKDDCNVCICNDGIASCTKMACPGGSCYYKGVNYRNGETFKDDCNTCTCTDGNAACTLMACPGGSCYYKGVDYRNGESFKDDCNTCTCTDGKAACTLMACPGGSCHYKGIEYLDGESFKDDCNTCTCTNGNAACTLMACPGGSCYYKGVDYRNGESFKDDCNTCTCTDGKAACTLMACPGGSCLYKGVEYLDGESFKDDCNTCTCTNGNAACTLMACPGGSCYYKGVDYRNGESFKDDCNTCTCTDGKAACTLMACPGGSCLYKGVEYLDGESFKDDCNTCTCTNGNAACTLMACPGGSCYYKGVDYRNGESFKDDCNTCTCTDGKAACTLMACPGGSCLYKGVEYLDGESFKDDCNTCTCTNGNAACTLMACPGGSCYYKGVDYRNGESFKDDCNTCTCTDGKAACTLMACPGGSCLYKGVEYLDGESFKDDCNTCTCTNGNAACTLMACPGGSCYYKGVDYRNGESFKDDCNTCTCTDGKAACTLMACPKRPCFYNGVNYKDGETFNDDCNACVCSDGIAECTMMACPDVKPGICPPPTAFGVCVDMCTTDLSCPGREKCCRHRCGKYCLLPVSGGKQCWHKGVNYNDGERFKDDCNVCICNDGIASCTKMACPDAKPGDCPPPIAVGPCVDSCAADLECPGTEKCCSNGCGRLCLPPRNVGLPCMYKGITYNDGESFKDECNTCTCSNGNAACTLMACPDVKPGRCPAPVGAAGICIDECSDDNSCHGADKCCSNGCGSVCMTPEFGGKPCIHNGITYNDGESFKDDCNTCRCSNGNAGCTRMACPKTPCMYKGVKYNHNETFQDDCNTCTCHDGRTACTSKACRTHCIYNGVKYYDGENFKDNCNTCTCTDGRASCTQMACPGTDCLYKGINYRHGQTFKDECNTCTCNDGRAACTLMACPEEKPGICPPPIGIGICVDRCTTDLSCRGIMKCCSNGCGTDCITPIKGKTCYHKGIEYADGERFYDDCNTCRCNNGNAACTKKACGGACTYKGLSYQEGESFKDDCNTCKCTGGKVTCTLMACPDTKPGTCPIPVGGGICVEDCSTDTTCPGIQKCCSNGCGHVCMNPDFGGRSCYHNGMNYTDGESFKDDCNTCTCANGNVACTLMACPPKKVCYHNGMTHQDGDQFQDDCNTCACTDGRVMCTYKACGRSCDHNGISYQDGESFKDNCNTCTCNNGSAACTLMECGGEKPGRCPRPVLFTRCTDRCNGDNSCPGKQKCCNNWCGNTCMEPAERTDICAEVICPAVECPRDHTPYTPPGQCCQICRPPIGEKPGSCPRHPESGPCFNMCTTDYSCPGQQKCCDNRCGRSCMRPTGLDQCDGIYCPPLRCRVQHTPPGRCCPVCGQGRGQGRGRGRGRGRRD